MSVTTLQTINGQKEKLTAETVLATA
jgi:hypothetical protein